MHKYFLIPVIIFFIIICLLVIYSQYFYVDWKYDFIPESFDPKTERYKEKILPEICDDDAEIKIIKQTNDFIEKRVWKDQAEITNVPSIHAIYFLPCDGEDREFDVFLQECTFKTIFVRRGVCDFLSNFSRGVCDFLSKLSRFLQLFGKTWNC